MTTITREQKQQFAEEGFFILENAIPEHHIALLRSECQSFIDKADACAGTPDPICRSSSKPRMLACADAPTASGGRVLLERRLLRGDCPIVEAEERVLRCGVRAVVVVG